MRDANERIAKMLVEMGLIDDGQASEAIANSGETGKTLGQSIYELGFVSDPALLQLLTAQGFATPWLLDGEKVDGSVLRLLSPSVCREHTLIPVCRCQDLLVVAMANTRDSAVIERVRVLTGLRIEAVAADGEKIRKVLEDSLNEDRQLVEDQSEVEQPSVSPSVHGPTPWVPAISLDDEVICETDTAPVAGLVNQIISDAVRREAEGILIEPTSNGYEIRYRIDGELRSIGDIPNTLKPMVEARLRLLAKLDLIGPETPQKGRIEINLSSRKIAFNVDVLSTDVGSRFLLQLERGAVTAKRLEDTGIDQVSLNLLRRSHEDGEGLVLIAASKGEDRAELMYSLLTDLVAPTRDIVSCEDGVSVEIAGVSQVRCPSSQLPKSALIRSVIEQSPEVVMVGTLDVQCAPYAVRGALSGRLVVASLEANSAAKAIACLIDLGADPFLASASLKGVLAQRRVKSLCKDCRRKEGDAWSAVGCSECDGSGYKGFVSVFEFLPVTNVTAGLIARKAPLHQIEQLAAEDGFRPMLLSALAKCERGTTDSREIERVFGRFDGPDLQKAESSEEEMTTDVVVTDDSEPIEVVEETEGDSPQPDTEVATDPGVHLRVEEDTVDEQHELQEEDPLAKIESREIHLTTHKDEDLDEHFSLESYQLREKYKDYYDAS